MPLAPGVLALGEDGMAGQPGAIVVDHHHARQAAALGDGLGRGGPPAGDLFAVGRGSV
ncbi:Type II secretion system protein J (fragment) [Sphingomonas sp. EC-HK361]